MPKYDNALRIGHVDYHLGDGKMGKSIQSLRDLHLLILLVSSFVSWS